MAIKENYFVFVVCGTSEHLNTLNFSIKYLKYFSKNKIIVLTDTSRNETDINHDKIIDIKTPEKFTNHQASIYLKTAIHRFVPKCNNYCYLDTDVIALSTEVDDIFNYQSDTIIFAPDHCRMRKFSPHSINCGCYEEQLMLTSQMERHLETFDLNRRISDTQLKAKQYRLLQEFEIIKKNKFKYGVIAVRYILSRLRFKLHEDAIFIKNKKYWVDAENNIILYHQKNFINDISKATGLKWNSKRQTWETKDGKNIYYVECDHLKDAIKLKFDIEIKESNYQHWNGGVFLFNDKSHEFLDSWHDKTMNIFTDPKWKTRDQGTLIATAWEFNIQHQSLLPKKFNFIADYNNKMLMLDPNTEEITDDAFKNRYKPAFMHVYHHFGTKGWSIWDWIESKIN